MPKQLQNLLSHRAIRMVPFHPARARARTDRPPKFSACGSAISPSLPSFLPPRDDTAKRIVFRMFVRLREGGRRAGGRHNRMSGAEQNGTDLLWGIANDAQIGVHVVRSKENHARTRKAHSGNVLQTKYRGRLKGEP